MGNTIRDIIKKPSLLFLTLGHRGLFNWMSDERYLKIAYKIVMGKKLNLDNPRTFNEKLQWLKLHDRRPEYIMMVDKHEVKKYVKDIIGEEYIIPTLGVWDHFDQIDFEKLPEKFVLKCTHGSGDVVICKDKSKFDKVTAKRKIERCLRHNFYWSGREWPYKMIKPRVIAEKYIEDEATKSLDDYKFFCFDGMMDNVMVVRGRADGKPKFYHFDREWNLCRFNRLGRALPEGYAEPKPPFINDMIKIAEYLSKNMIHVRIDLYEANCHVYFGEYTLYNQSGWESGFDDFSDGYLGSLIKLPYEK